MATVHELLAKKRSEILSVGPDTSALDAAQLMNEHRVGALLVLEDGRLAGIFTERDILRRIVAERRDPAATTIRDVMTHEVACCHPHTSVEEARFVLMDRRIRHLPVVDASETLIGLISIGDVNAHQAHEHEHTICVLNDYIQGRA